MVDIRIDRAQEGIESYEAMRQRIRDSYASRRPAFQNDQDGTLEISTELDSSFSINGFYDRISVFRVPLVDELYTAEQIAQNGGITAVSAATGATSGGMVTAATGISTAGIIGGAVLVAAVVGGGLALAGGSGDSDDSSSGSGGRVEVGSASAADFIGTCALRGRMVRDAHPTGAGFQVGFVPRTSQRAWGAWCQGISATV